MCYWKTKKKIIWWHFLISLTFIKGTGSQNTYCHLWKVMGQIISFVVALLLILVPCDWKMTLLLCFLSLNLTITLSLFFIRWEAWRSSGVTVVPFKESALHTLFSTAVLGSDWGIGLISMVSLRTYWALFKALHSKLVICFSSWELPFFEINSSEFSSLYFLIKSSNRLFRPLSLSVISQNFNNSFMSSSLNRLSTWGLVNTMVNFQNKM